MVDFMTDRIKNARADHALQEINNTGNLKGHDADLLTTHARLTEVPRELLTPAQRIEKDWIVNAVFLAFGERGNEVSRALMNATRQKDDKRP